MPSDVIDYEGESLPAPKFATARNYDRPTIGGRRAEFARIWLGRPLMPWQRWVADVAGEIGDDGLPFYDMVVTTVQRQAGKSHLSMTKTCERCVSVPGWKSWYTAQSGQDARDQFLGFSDDVIAGTPLERLVTVLRGNGHEVMKFPNRSQLRPHPPHEKAMHGKQSDENDIDEAWAFAAEDGATLMQAISPTQATRPSAQTWVWSAGGTASSTWLAQLVADGRSGADTITLNGEPSRVAYFEWGIPDDLALDDLQEIASYHPAYGHTVTLRSLSKMRTQIPDDAGFARAAGNRWTEIVGGAIKSEVWRNARHDPVIPDDAVVGYGAARAADGTEVALAAAAALGDAIVVEIVEVIPSAYDAASRIAGLLDGAAVAVGRSGPSANLADGLARLGVPLIDLDARREAASVAEFLDGLSAGKYRARPNPSLDAAVRVAGTRRVADGGTAWARVSAGASIAALDAADKACWALTHPAPVESGKPESHFAA